MSLVVVERPFCSTPTCDLYLCCLEGRARGEGHWARLPNGHVIGQTIVNGTVLCDVCAKAVVKGDRPVGVTITK